ncbi:dienelactone hydrolase family protein [Arthrobacter sp. 35W]|uniref:dienelactone hydrolase family protein n=1 Tax=Arthrobacter sp. 35W TaxID=1132441 RepID=UPI0003FA8B51|nr:dienelactone hydrolase family protein [Arthrobacter sp. 35W]
MGEMITLSGGVSAYLKGPPGWHHGRHAEAVPLKGGLIVLHEVWGLVDHIKDVADRFAAEGYLVLAPDLLDGAGPSPSVLADLQEKMQDPQGRNEIQPQLRELMAPMRAPDFAAKALAGVQACFEHLNGLESIGSLVGVVGFCFGGSYSFSLAVAEPRLKAAVPFYGHADFTAEQLRGITAPVLAFYGEKDERLMATLPALRESMKAAGVDFTAVVYPDAGHAFFNDTNAAAYREDDADDAWSRTLEFLSDKLA